MAETTPTTSPNLDLRFTLTPTLLTPARRCLKAALAPLRVLRLQVPLRPRLPAAQADRRVQAAREAQAEDLIEFALHAFLSW